MDASDRSTLTAFAKSMLARAIDNNADIIAPSLRALPNNMANEALHAALVAQYDLIEAMTARHAAEISVMNAAIERMEREIAAAKGQVERLSILQSTQSVELQRALHDAHEVAQIYVDRLTENFEQRVRALA